MTHNLPEPAAARVQALRQKVRPKSLGPNTLRLNDLARITAWLKANDRFWHAYVVLGCMTGMRPGELAALRPFGIEHALLDTGEFAARGHNPAQQPWTLGVADPRDQQAMAAIVRTDGRCLATSGDYAAAFTPDFAHHHIFDPATGDSPTELASVSVVAPSAVLADGLSTAFMVMGAKKSHALAATLAGVDLLTINKRGVVWRSPGFPLAA